MKIQWLGHSAFLLTSQKGTHVVTDPYLNVIGYKMPDVTADVATVSHQHGDHNNVKALHGSPVVYDKEGEFAFKDVKINGIKTFHDAKGGAERGGNVVFVFEIDGVRICHLGDFGEKPTTEFVQKLGKIDVLLVPVGGNYTVSPENALTLCDMIEPSMIIPMHYKTSDCTLDVATIEDFLMLCDEENVTVYDSDVLPVMKSVFATMEKGRVVVMKKKGYFGIHND